jgi:hypothetical protein
MRSLTILLILFSSNLFAQQTTDWINFLEKPEFPMFNELKASNQLADYVTYDLSPLLSPSSDFLGFIGSDYKRIHVNFNFIKKSEATPNLYFISGKTTVSNNTCDFEGTLTIEQFREFKNMYYGVDSMYSDSGFKAQGIAIGTYKLSENPKQKHVGTFEGIMTLWWYLDKDGEIRYYDLNSHSDRFKNNQYVGAWSEYGKPNSRVCNWGEYRIPFSGDLDWGAGEFSINPKYYEKGWQEYNRN